MEAFVLVKDQGTSGVVLEIFSLDAAELLSAQMRKDPSRNHSLHDSAGRSREGLVIELFTFPQDSNQ